MIQSTSGKILAPGVLEGQLPPWTDDASRTPQIGLNRSDAYRRLLNSIIPRCFVASIGYSLPSPDKWLSNTGLAELHLLRVPNDSQDGDGAHFRKWVLSKTGISGRYHDDLLDISDLIIRSGLMAVEHARLECLDNATCRVIISTTRLPSDLDSLGDTLSRAFSIDRANISFESKACSSISFQIEAANRIFQADSSCGQVLIVGCDQGSKFSDFNDVSSAILFGDGAGALLLLRKHTDDTTARGIYHIETGSIEDSASFLYFADSGKVVMANGQAIFKNASRAMQTVLPTLLNKGGISFKDVDRIILHQANLALPGYVQRKFLQNIAPDGSVAPANIRHLGNTGAASPYLLFAESFQAGLLKQGDIALIGAVGMGMHYGGVLLVL